MSHSFKLALLRDLQACWNSPSQAKNIKHKQIYPHLKCTTYTSYLEFFSTDKIFGFGFILHRKLQGSLNKIIIFHYSQPPTKMYNFHVPHDRLFQVPLTNIKYESEFNGFKDFIKTSKKIQGCILASGSQRFCKYVRASYIFCAVLGKNIA